MGTDGKVWYHRPGWGTVHLLVERIRLNPGGAPTAITLCGRDTGMAVTEAGSGSGDRCGQCARRAQGVAR